MHLESSLDQCVFLHLGGGGEYVTERVRELSVLQLVPSLSNSLYLSSVSVRGPSVHEQSESYLSPWHPPAML